MLFKFKLNSEKRFEMALNHIKSFKITVIGFLQEIGLVVKKSESEFDMKIHDGRKVKKIANDLMSKYLGMTLREFSNSYLKILARGRLKKNDTSVDSNIVRAIIGYTEKIFFKYSVQAKVSVGKMLVRLRSRNIKTSINNNIVKFITSYKSKTNTTSISSDMKIYDGRKVKSIAKDLLSGHLGITLKEFSNSYLKILVKNKPDKVSLNSGGIAKTRGIAKAKLVQVTEYIIKFKASILYRTRCVVSDSSLVASRAITLIGIQIKPLGVNTMQFGIKHKRRLVSQVKNSMLNQHKGLTLGGFSEKLTTILARIRPKNASVVSKLREMSPHVVSKANIKDVFAHIGSMNGESLSRTKSKGVNVNVDVSEKDFVMSKSTNNQNNALVQIKNTGRLVRDVKNEKVALYSQMSLRTFTQKGMTTLAKASPLSLDGVISGIGSAEV